MDVQLDVREVKKSYHGQGSFGLVICNLSTSQGATCVFETRLVVSAFCRNTLFAHYSGPA
jgi:hypothetical protein